jgi:hydroxyacyl-ACP dehydratase HTD2-like protein with hotdog domain
LLQQIGSNRVTKFKFRALHPVFDRNDFQVCGSLPDAEGNCKLWIQDHTGALCMDASATVVID